MPSALMKKGSTADVFLGDVINAQKGYFNKQMILSAVFFSFYKNNAAIFFP